MHACMHACMHAMHVRGYACKYVCMWVFVYFLHTCMSARAYEGASRYGCAHLECQQCSLRLQNTCHLCVKQAPKPGLIRTPRDQYKAKAKPAYYTLHVETCLNRQMPAYVQQQEARSIRVFMRRVLHRFARDAGPRANALARAKEAWLGWILRLPPNAIPNVELYLILGVQNVFRDLGVIYSPLHPGPLLARRP